MQLVRDVLARCGLAVPDGRPLYAYDLSDDEYTKLGQVLRFRVASGQKLSFTCQAFTIWSAERMRREFPGGQLTWEFLFEGLALPSDRATAVELTELGLKLWRRPLRQSSNGDRRFLYSLLVEGGLPDLVIQNANRYRNALLSLIAEIEMAGSASPQFADAAAQRAIHSLPEAFHSDDIAMMLSELAQAIDRLKQAIPAQIPSLAAEAWLDSNQKNWRQELPLRLSSTAFESLIRPALTAEKAQSTNNAAPVRRELRRRADGLGWIGIAAIATDALIAKQCLPNVEPSLRLRLAASSGATFLAVPDALGGWRLKSTFSTEADILMPAAPHQPIVLAAYADGRALGDVVLDAGVPAPDEAPSLWRPTDVGSKVPDALVPLSGGGRTKAPEVFLLAARNATPTLLGEVSMSEPVEGPGGLVWALRGSGAVQIGSQRLRFETGSEAEEAPHRLVVFGDLLHGFSLRNGAPVWLGSPEILGAIGERSPTQIRRGLKYRDLPRLLGGVAVDWTEDEAVLARLRLIVLPKSLKLRLRESVAGEVKLEAEGLVAGWHIVLTANGQQVLGVADASGRLAASLRVKGLPGVIELRILDPKTGRLIELDAPWPSHTGMLIDPQGQRLSQNLPLSLSGLLGWRGQLPQHGGAVLLQRAGSGVAVGFKTAGDVRLASLRPLLAQVLSLCGADGRVHVRLTAGGTETPRIEVGRYDWTCEDTKAVRHLGAGRTSLFAVRLDEPSNTRTRETHSSVDLSEWLQDDQPSVWLVQGRSEVRGIMRPFVWSSQPLPPTNREDRINQYSAESKRSLTAPPTNYFRSEWDLIQAIRQEGRGDAGSLDQVQALARVPAAAVAHLLLAHRNERSVALDLETEAPLWWPLVPCSAWAEAVNFVKEDLLARLEAAGLSGDPALEATEKTLRRAAGEIVALRPELLTHLGQAFRAASLSPLALSDAGADFPLAVAGPRNRLERFAQEAARRFEDLPQGVGQVQSVRLSPPGRLSDEIQPLLHAPLLVAEVASGLRPHPTPDEILRLIALRWADPQWFDNALPAALSLALEMIP